MHEDRNTGTAEVKAVGQEILQFGARFLQAGKEWFNERRHDMAQRYNQDEQRNPGGRDYAGERSQGAVSRWDDEDGGYGHSQYTASQSSYGQQQGQQRYGRERSMGGGHGQNAQWQPQGQQTPRYGQSLDDEYGNSRGYGRQGYGQDYGSQSRDYGASGRDSGWQDRGYGSERGAYQSADYGAGRGRNRDEELSAYGRQGSLGGGRGAYPGNYQAGQYGEDRSREDRWQESHAGGRQGSGYQSMSQPGYGSSMQHGEHYSGMVGGFRGRGPKNYSRSDDRITEDLNERLMDADDIDASEVSVRVKDGVATLEGTVQHRWTKHRIEDVAESCSGVKDVENRIRVERTGAGQDRSMAGSSTTSTSRRTGTTSTGASMRSATGTGQDGNDADPDRAGTSAH
ncbi:BON domain-containing protein [Luteimonas cucumeris]|uniref:BON domain-containing protein n=1 Tax=Luteimonas cucumeris TaxID=985012 RepID=A0A562L229_9GAMM|nr:BON domain-containing protein [Luteimonas cucumeris]TWI01729.1 BON domain-containing protein [Luteimonas cucumeris]